ncbi:MAG: branched-chain amino acid aminotransferase [Gammaproteobacteria bacterium]
MLSDLHTVHPRTSRLSEVNFDALGFGDVFSDHMFSLCYDDGRWHTPEVLPYGPIEVEPSCVTLHYGQSVFEGLKAFKGHDHQIRLFRPDKNYERLTHSCERLCIPMLPEAYFYEGIEALVRLDHEWIPSRRGQSLYVRPIIIGTEGLLEVRPGRSFRFLIMTAPVRAYFDASASAIGLKVEERYTRASPGGTGAAKTAGNYAASLYPGERARAEGYAQVLWLDGVEHRYVEEVGAMNIFFRMGGKVVTPELRGTILHGVTRDSVLTLLQDSGEPVEERRIAIDELVDGVRAGEVTEAFGAGTAAIIAPVGKIAYKDEVVTINQGEAGPLTQDLYDRITRIQLGETNDLHNWNRIVPLQT